MIDNKFPSLAYDILLIKYLYIVGYPLSRFFIRYNINPNMITSLSNVFVVFSLFSLYLDNIIEFIVFWIIAQILDVCDGTVARLTDQSSEFGSFYDHFSDQIKIFLFFISISLYFDEKLVVILSFFGMGIFFLYIDISKRIDIFKLKYAILETENKNKSQDISKFKIMYNHIFLIDIHTMLVLPFMVISYNIALIGLSLFMLVSLKNFFGSLRQMIILLKIRR